MKQEQNQVDQIIDHVLGMAPEERASYVEKACEGDEPFRQLVMGTLRAYEQAGLLLKGKIEVLTPMSTSPMPLNEKSGDQIGRYKLLQPLGEGGCGVVYLAEQSEPMKRRVALKVIKLGMDTKQVIARFEAERQALALMEHPNIAKVLDGGVTEAGR